MILNAVLAVALGLAPTDAVGRSQIVDDDEYQGLVGRYSQSTDARGAVHLKGFDTSGRPYNIAVSPDGRVEGLVGATYVRFDYSRAA